MTRRLKVVGAIEPDSPTLLWRNAYADYHARGHTRLIGLLNNHGMGNSPEYLNESPDSTDEALLALHAQAEHKPFDPRPISKLRRTILQRTLLAWRYIWWDHP